MNVLRLMAQDATCLRKPHVRCIFFMRLYAHSIRVAADLVYGVTRIMYKWRII